MLKKVFCLTTLLLLLFTSSAFAAVPLVGGGSQGEIGFSIYKMDLKDTDWPDGGKEKFNANEFYGSAALTKDWTINFDYLKHDGDGSGIRQGANFKNKYTSIDVQYNVDKSVGLLLGNIKAEREYNGGGLNLDLSRNTTYLGVTAKTGLTKGIDAYTTLKMASKITDWTVGATYNLENNLFLDLNYRKLKTNYSEQGYDFDAKSEGMGFGIGYKF